MSENLTTELRDSQINLVYAQMARDEAYSHVMAAEHDLRTVQDEAVKTVFDTIEKDLPPIDRIDHIKRFDRVATIIGAMGVDGEQEAVKLRGQFKALITAHELPVLLHRQADIADSTLGFAYTYSPIDTVVLDRRSRLTEHGVVLPALGFKTNILVGGHNKDRGLETVIIDPDDSLLGKEPILAHLQNELNDAAVYSNRADQHELAFFPAKRLANYYSQLDEPDLMNQALKIAIVSAVKGYAWHNSQDDHLTNEEREYMEFLRKLSTNQNVALTIGITATLSQAEIAYLAE